MNNISFSRICRNSYRSVSDTWKGAGPVLKKYIPCLVSAALFRVLSQQVLILPQDTVVYYASNLCETISWALTAKAALAFFTSKQYEQPHIDNDLNVRNRMNELEISRLKSEIDYLQDRLKNTNLNLVPEH